MDREQILELLDNVMTGEFRLDSEEREFLADQLMLEIEVTAHGRLDAQTAGIIKSNLEQRCDSNTTAVLSQQLEHMLAREQEVKYAPLKALSFFPVTDEVDPGAETYSYEVYDEVGMAKIISNYADDLPMVDIKAEKVVATIQTLGVGLSYSRQDLRRAAKSRKPLVDRKRRAAMRAMDRKVDDIVSFGAPEGGLKGILNHPNITVLGAAAPASGSDASWPGDKTPKEVEADMHELARQAWILTKENFAADTMLLPPERFTYVQETPWGVDNSDSILTVFLKNNRFIRRVDSWHKLSTAGANGGPRALAYAMDPEVLRYHFPMRPQPTPPQQRALAFDVFFESRVGGMDVYEALAVAAMDGI